MTKSIAYISAGAAFCTQALAQDMERLVLPSGLEVYVQEMRLDRTGVGAVQRFRFVAPEFAGVGEAFELVRADLEYLCNSYALARLPAEEPVPDQIVISLADRPSDFGVVDPSVIQVFEAYSVKDGTCIWESF